MKITTFILFAFLTFTTFGLQAQKAANSVASKTDQVTVYRSGAIVNRTADVSLKTGDNELIITGLSPDLDPNSIQVFSTGEIVLASVSHSYSFLHEMEKPDKLVQLESKRDDLAFTLDEKKAAIEVLTAEENMLISNQQIKGEDQALDLAHLKQVTAYYRQRLGEIKKERLAIQKETKTLAEELEKLEKQIREYHQSIRGKRSAQINLTVQSTKQQKINLEVRYLVRNAGWSTSYDVHADELTMPLRLVHKANIFNRSQEDWTNAAISLSTGNARQHIYLPELSPWWLRFHDPIVYRGQNIEKQQAMDGMVEEAEPPRTMPAPPPPPVEISENATTYTFDIDGRMDIPADGKEKTVVLDEHKLGAAFEYNAIPKLDPSAFLTAHITDWEKAILSPGAANLFLEKAFIGRTHLNPGIGKDTLSLSFGRDEGIAITRKKDSEYEKKQFLGNKVTNQSAWEITVRNNKSRSVKIIIRDQIPISTHQDISVTVDERSGGELDTKTGIIRWELNLEPGATKKLRLQYSVKYPKDKNLWLP
jgi:uncharacterized protein (TIGR02231 family)